MRVTRRQRQLRRDGDAAARRGRGDDGKHVSEELLNNTEAIRWILLYQNPPVEGLISPWGKGLSSDHNGQAERLVCLPTRPIVSEPPRYDDAPKKRT